ncbi:MAG: DUF3187 family protein [Ectothiorhodospiraceae bacterium]|nr:DUF3187 family protein [Ectothiorhodospiraceae bacterium]
MIDLHGRLPSACVVLLMMSFPQIACAENPITRQDSTHSDRVHIVGVNSIEPFFSFNKSPLIQIHALPAIERAGILSTGRVRYRLVNSLASNYTFDDTLTESVLFDGETNRSTFIYSQGVGRGWEWGVQIPYISHAPGSLDRFIDQWHDFFGLPEGGRNAAPRGRLTYRYQHNGVTELALTNRTAGIGDVRLKAGRQWPSANVGRRMAIRATLSLPTGDSDALQGSGAAEFALWATADQREQWFAHPGSLFGGGGLLLMGDGKVLKKQQRRAVAFGSLGAGMQVLPWITLKLQADINSSFYDDSALVQVNATAVQLLMGGDLQLAKNVKLSLMVSEDISVHASPDVVFQMGLVVE